MLTRKIFIFLYLLLLTLILFGNVVITLGAVELRHSTYSENVYGPKVIVIRVDGTISTWTVDYIKEAIDIARDEKALIVMELNTPGGLLDPAFEIADTIANSDVPIVGYVVGRWALSAGTLILFSTHIAAMQPITTIGSMQPVLYDPVTGAYTPVNDTKIINALTKKVEQYVEYRGRNVTAAIKCITENANYDANEALKLKLIEVLADNLDDLLVKIDGYKVKLIGNKEAVLITKGYKILRYEGSIRVRFIKVLSDPMVSGLLMSLGFLVTIFSILSAHLHITPIGVLLLMLGLLGSGFNVNLAAMFLLVLGAILLTIELVTPGFGIIGGSGIVMLAVGFMLLPTGGKWYIGPGAGYWETLRITGISIGIFFGALTSLILYKVVKVRKRRVTLWEFKGKIGRAIDPIGPEKPGYIVVEGEYWRALSDEHIKPGDKVIVIGKEEGILIVKKYEE